MIGSVEKYLVRAMVSKEVARTTCSRNTGTAELSFLKVSTPYKKHALVECRRLDRRTVDPKRVQSKSDENLMDFGEKRLDTIFAIAIVQ